jgi:hypothetical protein
MTAQKRPPMCRSGCTFPISSDGITADVCPGCGAPRIGWDAYRAMLAAEQNAPESTALPDVTEWHRWQESIRVNDALAGLRKQLFATPNLALTCAHIGGVEFSGADLRRLCFARTLYLAGKIDG